MRLIDADKIVEVAEHAYGEWNKAMGAAEGRQINRCYKMQELCKAVKSVANDCPTIDPKNPQPILHWKKTRFGYECPVCGAEPACCKCGLVDRSRYCSYCGTRLYGD